MAAGRRSRARPAAATARTPRRGRGGSRGRGRPPRSSSAAAASRGTRRLGARSPPVSIRAARPCRRPRTHRGRASRSPPRSWLPARQTAAWVRRARRRRRAQRRSRPDRRDTTARRPDLVDRLEDRLERLAVAVDVRDDRDPHAAYSLARVKRVACRVGYGARSPLARRSAAERGRQPLLTPQEPLPAPRAGRHPRSLHPPGDRPRPPLRARPQLALGARPRAALDAARPRRPWSRPARRGARQAWRPTAGAAAGARRGRRCARARRSLPGLPLRALARRRALRGRASPPSPGAAGPSTWPRRPRSQRRARRRRRRRGDRRRATAGRAAGGCRPPPGRSAFGAGLARARAGAPRPDLQRLHAACRTASTREDVLVAGSGRRRLASARSIRSTRAAARPPPTPTSPGSARPSGSCCSTRCSTRFTATRSRSSSRTSSPTCATATCRAASRSRRSPRRRRRSQCSGSLGAVARARRAPAALPALALAARRSSSRRSGVVSSRLSRAVERRADAFSLRLDRRAAGVHRLRAAIALQNLADPDAAALAHRAARHPPADGRTDRRRARLRARRGRSSAGSSSAASSSEARRASRRTRAGS